MRSSVTVILSNPPPDTTMSYPDYSQTVEDHQCLLVLINLIGKQMKQKLFNRLYDRIVRHQHFQVQDSQGGVRGIWVRYKKTYPVENNEWGDFQAHRKVLGLICIGKCSNQGELEELCKIYETTKEKYNSTLFDSRCLIYGFNQTDAANQLNDSLPTENKTLPNSASADNDHASSDREADGIADMDVLSMRKQTPDGLVECDSGIFSSPLAEGEKMNETISEIETIEENFNRKNECNVNSVIFTHHVPIPKKKGHVRNASLPASPCRSTSGIYESCNFSLPPSPTAIREYPRSPSSSETSSSSSHYALLPPHSLKSQLLFYPSTEDCASLEQDLFDFICSIFWILESKRLDKSHEKLDRLPLLCAPFEKKDFVGIDLDTRSYKKRSQGRMKKHVGDLSLLAGLTTDAINYYVAGADILKSVNDWLWLGGCYEGLCAASVITMYPRQKRQLSLQRNSSFTAGSPSLGVKSRTESFSSHSLPNGLDPVEFKCKNSLSSNEIIEKYKEAIIHYSKFNKAVIIDIEANIKATKILIQQDKCLQASQFLQNIVLFNLQISDEEKIQRFTALSNLYAQIGFHRKAAFFKRVAAVKCITPQQDKNPNWSQCYYLLLQVLEGYKLSLDSKTFTPNHGWPTLQIQILQNLVAISRRMGNIPVSIRHMTFLLHTMFDHLTTTERKEFCYQLEVLTNKCEGVSIPLALDNGFILPPVNLINLPKVKSFKLQNLAPHLRPIKISSRPPENNQSGPFIFSPLQLGPLKEKNRLNNKMDFKWVERDVCEVTLQVFNPLSFELKVMNMGLLPDGIEFETFPASLSLPAESGPYPVKLLVTPLSTGTLEILGYTTHVFGVKSNCRLRDLPYIRKPSYVIDVVPALPQIQITTSCPKASTFSSFGDVSCIVTNMALTLHAGASQECTITLMNCSSVKIEKIDITLESRLEKDLESQFCTWSIDNLMTQLPILPDNSASFTLYIHAVGDFQTLAKAYPDEGSETVSVSSGYSQAKSNRTSSLGSLTTTRSSVSYSSFRRKISEYQPPPTPPSFPLLHNPKVVEMILKVQYTGGPGMLKDYCRQSAVAINVEVSPSVLITKWDVLPAERATHCYLVLDILNMTEYEMEVHYTSQKQILIEARETCRIPVPVERCPLSKLSSLSDEEVSTYCRQHVASLVDLKWNIPSLEVSGTASLSNLEWTPAMLSLIRMSPIQWEIGLNDMVFKPECDFSFSIGEIVNLTITIGNYSEATLTELRLKVDVYQDHQNGQYNYRLENKISFIGCDSIIISQIQVQDMYRHHCGLIFFVPGIYKLDIHCSNNGTNKNSPSPDKLDRALKTEVQTWKCTPIIELTITEK